MPSKLWERIKLSENYATALKQIDDRLIYWPNFLIHKCKQRLTRLVQVAIQSRRLAAQDKRLGEKLVGMPNKVRRRERKALAAAKLERSIEKELVERLRSGAYGDKPLNVDENIWKKVLKGLERQGEAEGDVDEDELESGEEESGEDEEEEEDGENGEIEYVSGDEELEEEAEEMADLEDWLGGSGASEFEEDSEEDSEEETGSEEDSEEEDGGSEEEAPRKGAKVTKKGKVDDSKKRKRGKTVQQPRKREFRIAQTHQPCVQITNMSS